MKGGVGGKKRNQALKEGQESGDTGDCIVNVHEGLLEDREKEDERSGEKMMKSEENAEAEGEEQVEEKEGEAEDEVVEERPKLDDGFFEIETIRRKRVRKGQPQYLIKWRGWPETANTWEPLENLLSCTDVIDAFEESLRSGKHGRKRKRKHSLSYSQPKKKQSRSGSAAATNSGTDAKTVAVDKPPSSTSLKNYSYVDISITTPDTTSKGDINGDLSRGYSSKTVENDATINVKQLKERNEENEYDPKLSELRGMVSHDESNVDKLASCSLEGRANGVDRLPNGFAKTTDMESVQNNRCIGAKRRKSGSVKRFKQDSDTCSLLQQNPVPDAVLDSIGTITKLLTECPGVTETNSIPKSKVEEFHIMKIIKPISLSASVSDNVQDVLVTFVALRSDGTEVMVDNRFLKAHNPLLLIDFYEQHLKYYPSC